MAAINTIKELIIDDDPDKSLDNLLSHTDMPVGLFNYSNKLSDNEFKLTTKPWITLGTRNSIKRKEKIFGKYNDMKNSLTREDIHIEYKTIRKCINGLMYHNKKHYYRKYFNQ